MKKIMMIIAIMMASLMMIPNVFAAENIKIEAPDGSEEILGKQVKDLQENIQIDDTGITGTLKYVKDYVGFSNIEEEQQGNFLVINVTNFDEIKDTVSPTNKIEVGFAKSKEEEPEKWIELKGDGYFVGKISETSEKKILKVKYTKDGEPTVKEYDFSKLVLEKEEIKNEETSTTPEEMPKEEQNPDTEDINLILIVTMLTLASCGLVCTMKKRFNE